MSGAVERGKVLSIRFRAARLSRYEIGEMPPETQVILRHVCPPFTALAGKHAEVRRPVDIAACVRTTNLPAKVMPVSGYESILLQLS